jgi:hypothetical protein
LSTRQPKHAQHYLIDPTSLSDALPILQRAVPIGVKAFAERTLHGILICKFILIGLQACFAYRLVNHAL